MIYFVLDELPGAVKIGLTHVDIEQRLSGLQVGNPRKLKLLGVTDGNRTTEARLHARLEPHRISGEWFDIHSKDVQHVLLRELNEIHNLEHKDDFWLAMKEAEERSLMRRVIDAARQMRTGGRYVTID